MFILFIILDFVCFSLFCVVYCAMSVSVLISVSAFLIVLYLLVLVLVLCWLCLTNFVVSVLCYFGLAPRSGGWSGQPRAAARISRIFIRGIWYVCIYIYIHTYIHAYIHIYIYIYIYMRAHLQLPEASHRPRKSMGSFAKDSRTANACTKRCKNASVRATVIRNEAGCVTKVMPLLKYTGLGVERS